MTVVVATIHLSNCISHVFPSGFHICPIYLPYFYHLFPIHFPSISYISHIFPIHFPSISYISHIFPIYFIYFPYLSHLFPIYFPFQNSFPVIFHGYSHRAPQLPRQRGGVLHKSAHHAVPFWSSGDDFCHRRRISR